MRRIHSCIAPKGPTQLLLLICLLLPLLSPAAELAGRVVDVPDANRITLLTERGNRLIVVLRGIKAPGQDSGKWRRIGQRQLRMLLAGRFVRVHNPTAASVGVILGEVRHGGADVALRLLRSGLAVTTDDKNLSAGLRKAYRQSEREARRRRVGFWQTIPNPTPARGVIR